MEKLRKLWGALPLPARAIAALVAVFCLGQVGFALMNLPNSFALLSGVACLLAAVCVAYCTLKNIFEEIE